MLLTPVASRLFWRKRVLFIPVQMPLEEKVRLGLSWGSCEQAPPVLSAQAVSCLGQVALYLVQLERLRAAVVQLHTGCGLPRLDQASPSTTPPAHWTVSPESEGHILLFHPQDLPCPPHSQQGASREEDQVQSRVERTKPGSRSRLQGEEAGLQDWGFSAEYWLSKGCFLWPGAPVHFLKA